MLIFQSKPILESIAAFRSSFPVSDVRLPIPAALSLVSVYGPRIFMVKIHIFHHMFCTVHPNEDFVFPLIPYKNPHSKNDEAHFLHFFIRMIQRSKPDSFGAVMDRFIFCAYSSIRPALRRLEKRLPSALHFLR